MMLLLQLSLLASLMAGAGFAQEVTLTGTGRRTSEASVPTGSYLSYSTTLTRPSSATMMGSITDASSRFATANSSGTTISTSSSMSQTTIKGTVAAGGSVTPSAPGNSTQDNSTQVPTTNMQGCNNYPQFCNRTYSNITEVCAHNSMFDSAGNAASNQELGVTTQLNDGIRMVEGQTQLVNGTLRFCHTSCDLLDAGPIVDYLTEVHDWVASHPYDVVTILLANGDYTAVDEFTGPIQASGLSKFAYIPPKVPMGIQDWPTLGSMIISGKRVVIFMDYKANQTAVPYILDQYSQMWETPFDPTNRTFPCTIQRPPNQTPEQTANKMYLLNHNLNQEINLLGASISVPNTVLLNVTNNVTGQGSLGNTTNNCVSDWHRPPKFLVVDYYNRVNGTVFEVAAKHNNVTYTRKCCGLPVSVGPKSQTVGQSLSLIVASIMLWTLFLP